MNTSVASRTAFKPQISSPMMEGAQILGLNIRNPTELISAVQEGFTSSVVAVFSGRLGMPVSALVEVMDAMSVRTYNRRVEEGRPLTREESETVYRYARISERAARLLGSRERARVWLTTPKLGLGGATPLAFARTEPGAEEVLNLIGRIDDGSFA
jgi:putative toxin-antitoxin system antitoxin component (TIGR02293 family)